MPRTYGPKRTERLAVRMTQEDRQLLEAAAAAARLSLSEFVRRTLEEAATNALEASRAE